MKNIVHWCMQKRMWSSHTYKSCTKAESILILGGWTVETKPNRKANPKGWIVADHRDVMVNPSSDFLNLFIKRDRLVYNKHDISFNMQEGELLLFDSDGCYTLRRSEQFGEEASGFIWGMRHYRLFDGVRQRA